MTAFANVGGPYPNPNGSGGITELTGAVTATGPGIATATISGLTNGQLYIGNTGNPASAAAITAGAGVTVTNGAGTVTLSENPVNTTKPAFLAYLATGISNVTGNGAAFQIGNGTAFTEVFDQANNFNVNGTFTSSVTARYQFDACVNTTGAVNATTYTLNIVTSNRTYSRTFIMNPGPPSQSINLSVLADMDLNDTAVVTITVSGEVANTVDIVGGATLSTYFSGFLVC